MRQQRQGRQAEWQRRQAKVAPQQLKLAHRAHGRIGEKRYRWPDSTSTYAQWAACVRQWLAYRRRHPRLPNIPRYHMILDFPKHMRHLVRPYG